MFERISNKLFLALTMTFLAVNLSFSQVKSLKAEIEKIARSSKGTIGVAAMNLSDNNQILLFNKDTKFPMQSTFKVPLAMAILSEVDKGKLSLAQKILLTKRDLLPDTWSPLREKYPDANVEVSLAEILSFTISQSDNNGCDILFRLLGGTPVVQKYVRNLGIKEMNIAATEEEMAREWNVQYTNWSKPAAMLKLYEIINRGTALSKSSNDFLVKIMTETSTGAGRIKGLLPAGTIVAHKTGTSGTNDKKVTGAINDAGIVTLPNGKKFAIVVFVANSTDDAKTSEAIIAKISKAAWNYYGTGSVAVGKN